MRFLIKNLFYLILLALIIGLGYFLVNTETGLQFITKNLSHFAPGKLEIQTVKGKLLGQFTLENISYQDKEILAKIKTLDLTWNPKELFRNKIVIENLTLNNANFQAQSSNKTDFNLTILRYIEVKQFVVNHLTFQQNNARIEFDGKLTQTWNATWKINIPELNQFIPNSGGTLISSGSLSGPLSAPAITANFQGTNLNLTNYSIKKLDGTINFNPNEKKESSLSLLANDVKINDLTFKNLNFDIHGHIKKENNSLIASLNMMLLKKHSLSGQFILPNFSGITDFNQPLQGKIIVQSNYLDWLLEFIPEIKNPRGNLQGTIVLAGTMAAPTTSTDFKLNEASVMLPNLGITLNKIDLHAEHQQNQLINIQGSFYSGTGQGQLNGTVDPKNNFSTVLNLKGDNLSIVNLPQYKIFISPDLQINLSNQILDLQGKILIPKADITPKLDGNAITLPSEVIFEDQAKSITSLPFDIALKINLSLGENIHIVFNELNTHLGGNIQITQNANSPTTAIGEFYATKGTYQAYGQALKIQEGRLIFTGGSIMNPGLNIRAVKQVKTVSIGGKSSFNEMKNELKPIYDGIEELTVGVQIDGTFEKPNVSLYSNSAQINQGDILSYMIFGHPQSQISDSENQKLINAASALNFSSKNPISRVVNGIQDKLGLNELAVQPTEIFDPNTGKVASTTSFVIGKQISSKLYAHYSVSLFAPISILNLRYQLSKRFAIQSETSTMDNGADLLYSIERD